MERLQSREEDDNDKVIPRGSVLTLLSNVEELYAVRRNIYENIKYVVNESGI